VRTSPSDLIVDILPGLTERVGIRRFQNLASRPILGIFWTTAEKLRQTPSILPDPRQGAGTREIPSMARKVLVLHGSNLNLLGRREPEKYGSTTLDEINLGLIEQGLQSGAGVETFQSNSEADLVGRVQQLMDAPVDFVIINPAAFTHTSVAIRDALAAVRVPFMEVHISNVFAREPFRHHSYFTDLAVGMICGLGPRGYELALEYALGRP